MFWSRNTTETCVWTSSGVDACTKLTRHSSVFFFLPEHNMALYMECASVLKALNEVKCNGGCRALRMVDGAKVNVSDLLLLWCNDRERRDTRFLAFSFISKAETIRFASR